MGKAGLQAYSIDSLVKSKVVPFPNHIKIDVDGIEPLILAGAQETLADVRLLLIIVEVDERDEKLVDGIMDRLSLNGFEQPVTLQSTYFEINHYLPICNYLFKRK
jgi:hypothetical protein